MHVPLNLRSSLDNWFCSMENRVVMVESRFTTRVPNKIIRIAIVCVDSHPTEHHDNNYMVLWM